ncbi:MAG: cation-translocating P-type ATPase [Sedimentisphaerales bacterium]|nr:cation-translocating P-type ATPase [Sedimentisphaerales bacterium]
MEPWWRLDAADIAKELETDLSSGLSSAEAQARLERYGRNQLKEAPKRSPWSIFLDQFKDFVIWVLIGAAVVSGFLQEVVDAVAIIAIVILNAILGFIQEYRAEQSLAALKKLSSPTSKTLRDGKHQILESDELVLGDVVELEAGDSVPADGRVAWVTSNFSTQEASLTGESTPVVKTAAALDERDTPLADRANMVYAGTSVASGRARAVVTETGMQTELGKIAGMIQEIRQEATPLQKKLEQFGKWIVYLCFVLVALVFVMEWWRGGKLIDTFLTAVSLAVAAIPEGLPAVVTIALALGVQRMVKRHALIRRLRSVETLGSATVICSDKTGTLTKNEMTVQAVYAGEHLFHVTGVGYAPTGEFHLDEKKIDPQDYPDLMQTLRVGVLCNGAQLYEDRGTYKIVGDPTEAALLTAGGKAGLGKQQEEQKAAFVDELPFDSERKKMTIIRKTDGHRIAFVKGAPDVLLADCADIQVDGVVRPLTPEDRQSIVAANNRLTDQAMRVLGVAYRDLGTTTAKPDIDTTEKDLTFVGLIAMIDPPREEVKQAIQECMSAGIKTVMITGDHKNTATAIARQLGFFGEGSLALSGEELDRWSQEQLERQVDQIPVYARVSPEHKLRVVRAWRARRDVVAMTGDGVNDAPAVKEADIGVAMGITGTDVTKQVSDMVVTDDNFASIVAAVEEGRGIYDNIQKFVHYLLSCNAGEILVMFLSSLIGLPVPLLPIHILWVNLVTDGLPALALGVDPVAKDIMKRPPRRPEEPVVSWGRVGLMLWQGFVISLCSLTAFCFIYYIENRWSIGQVFSALITFDIDRWKAIFTVPAEMQEDLLAHARSMAFVVLAFCQDFHSYNCRSQTVSLFKLGVFSNRKLIGATSVSIILNMSALYLPFFQNVLKTKPLTAPELVVVLCAASTPLWVMELVKWVRHRFARSAR